MILVNSRYRDNSWGVQVSKGPFAVSYARGTDKTISRTYVAGDIDDADKKQTRWGVSYNAGKVSVGYSSLLMQLYLLLAKQKAMILLVRKLAL